VAISHPQPLACELVFDALRVSIDDLTIPVERDAIVAAVSLRDRLDGHIARAVGEYGAAGLHEVDGSVTLGSWLSHRCGIASGSAYASRSARLHQLPVVRDALVDGLLSSGAVDVVLAKLPKRHLPRFADHEAELVPLLVGMPLVDVARAMADWRAKADALDPPTPADEKPDRFSIPPAYDGGAMPTGWFGPDLTATVAAALRVYDPGDHSLPLAERQALALGQALQVALDFNPSTKHRRHRPHVTVTVRDDHSASYLDTDGVPSKYGLDTLCCDAAWHTLTYEGRAAILRYGRTVRDWPPDLYNLIAARDGGCRWPGCTAPVHWCDVHHVEWWEHGGPTDADNGALFCRRHHRKLHTKQGWTYKLLPDGTGTLTAPDGTTEESIPRGLDPPRLPLPPT
jgi:hypothetical protein